MIKGGQLPSYINWVAGWSGEVKAELRDQKENLLLQGQKILELQNELGYDKFVQKFDAQMGQSSTMKNCPRILTES